MKTLLLIWSLVLGQCMAGPFFLGQQGAVAASSSSGLTLPAITSGTYVLQLIADDLTAGAAVSAWSSRVGGWSAAQGTVSKQPQAVSAALGGRTAVRFDRIDDFLSIASFNPGGLSAVTIFLVANITSSGGDDAIFETSVNGNVNNGTFIFYKTSANRAFLSAQQGGLNNSFQTTSTYVGAAYVFSGINDKSLSTDEATIWVDGASSGTRPINNNLSGTFSTYDSYIGARGGTSLFVGMDLAALIICSGPLSTTDRQEIENTLLAYY